LLRAFAFAAAARPAAAAALGNPPVGLPQKSARAPFAAVVAPLRPSASSFAAGVSAAWRLPRGEATKRRGSSDAGCVGRKLKTQRFVSMARFMGVGLLIGCGEACLPINS